MQAKQAQILIGTCGRLSDVIKRSQIKFRKSGAIVFDEADWILAAQDSPSVCPTSFSVNVLYQLIALLLHGMPNAQRVLCGTTVSALDVNKLSVLTPVSSALLLKQDPIPESIRFQEVSYLDESKKPEALKSFLESTSFASAIVFCNHRRQIY